MEYRGDVGQESEEKIVKSAEEWHFFLEGKTSVEHDVLSPKEATL